MGSSPGLRPAAAVPHPTPKRAPPMTPTPDFQRRFRGEYERVYLSVHRLKAHVDQLIAALNEKRERAELPEATIIIHEAGVLSGHIERLRLFQQLEPRP